MAKTSLPQSFACAFRGIADALKGGRNLKIQLGFAVAAAVLGIVLEISATQWAVSFACMGAVIGGECLNTAIESVVDLVSPEYHDLARKAKDCAAGGVLVMSAASVLVAIAIYLPPIIDWISGL